jgi:hypothetical protein
MIPDLRRKLLSILGADPDCTDAQLVERARYVRKSEATYKALHKMRPPHETTWGKVDIGEFVQAERGKDKDLAVWMVCGVRPHEEEVEVLLFRLVGPERAEDSLWITKRRSDPATVLGPVPQGAGAAALAELGVGA